MSTDPLGVLRFCLVQGVQDPGDATKIGGYHHSVFLWIKPLKILRRMTCKGPMVTSGHDSFGRPGIPDNFEGCQLPGAAHFQWKEYLPRKVVTHREVVGGRGGGMGSFLGVSYRLKLSCAFPGQCSFGKLSGGGWEVGRKVVRWQLPSGREVPALKKEKWVPSS